MRYVSIEQAKPGMKLGKAIFDNQNRVLLSKSSQLTSEYISRLSVRGYQGVYIEDEFSKGIEIEEVISVELRNRSVEAVKRCDLDELQNIAVNIVEEILSAEHSITIDVVDLRTYDDYTYKHSVNVAVITTIIGLFLEYSRNDLIDLCLAGLLHDIGKTRVDPDIINKPARLTKTEYQIVQEHARFSYEMLINNWTISSRTRQAVLHHHENEDGTGYPDNLIGDEIPEFAKIIHVADVYDALTSKRPYKKPYALAEAIEYLMGGGNILFDTDVVNAFIKAVPVYPKGTQIVLSNGESGIVSANTTNPLRPVIRLFDTGEDINLNNNLDYINVIVAPHTVVERNFVS